MPQDVTKYLPFKVGAIPRKAESTEVKPSSASSSSDGSAAVGVRQGENVEGTEGQVDEDDANYDLYQSTTATACQRSNGSATSRIR